MKLMALATMKIEGDIVEEFVRHTLRFVDRVIVVDNGSLDAARAILSEMESEGLPVSVWDGEAVPSAADAWTNLARRAFATFEMEYLLMLDVDEFVRAPSRSALEHALEALDGAHGTVPWVTYVPTLEDDAAEPRVLARLRHRLSREPYQFSKVVVHRSFAEDASASIARGNHALESADANVVSRQLAGIELAHVPVRTLEQVQSKALLGWPTIIAMGLDENPQTAYQWRRLNERLLNDPNWNSNDFLRLAWHYLDEEQEAPALVLDPLPTVERRYPRESPGLLALAIAFTNQLARYSARTELRVRSVNGFVHAGTEAHAGKVHDRFAMTTAALEPLQPQATVELERANAVLAEAREAELRSETQIVAQIEARQRADAQASLQAKLRADALAKLAAETRRYQTDLETLHNQQRELERLVDDMQRSNSWRLTLPIRIAATFLRKSLNRLRRRANEVAASGAHRAS